MKATRVLAMLLIVLAILMTGVGGLLDFLQSDYRISRQHAWNDGLFLLVLAIALLML